MNQRLCLVQLGRLVKRTQQLMTWRLTLTGIKPPQQAHMELYQLENEQSRLRLRKVMMFCWLTGAGEPDGHYLHD